MDKLCARSLVEDLGTSVCMIRKCIFSLAIEVLPIDCVATRAEICFCLASQWLQTD